jgi:2-amino-4-hydroxy-6-hydroxymethyldihydropteridine diphosphokinase
LPGCFFAFFPPNETHSAIDVTTRLCFNLHVETEAYIALGSNLGDRELNLLRAVAEIGKLPESRVTGVSPFYETSPVGVRVQPAFFNAVLRLSTNRTPHELLHCLQRIETEVFARTRPVRWGPRMMDLDLLLYGSQVITGDELTIPHPRMTERRFVLQPLCVLAPDLIHPVLGRSIADLLAALPETETVVQI